MSRKNSPRYLTQHNGTLRRVKDAPIGKNGALLRHFGVAKIIHLGIASHDKICLYLVNKSCFAQIDVSLIINTHTISLEYCKIHGHFAVACPPGHGSILRLNHAIYVYKINN